MCCCGVVSCACLAVVWCGVLWCGVVWCAVVWCGCGVVWCGVVWVWCGCLCACVASRAQVLRGSHKAGRIEHLMVGGQTGADSDRVRTSRLQWQWQWKSLPLPFEALLLAFSSVSLSSASSSPSRWLLLSAVLLTTHARTFRYLTSEECTFHSNGLFCFVPTRAVTRWDDVCCLLPLWARVLACVLARAGG